MIKIRAGLLLATLVAVFSSSTAGAAPADAPASATIRGACDIAFLATASNLKESGERVTFDLEFPVSLGEFDLKAPSVLGIVRVGDKVSVKATFTLTVSRSP